MRFKRAAILAAVPIFALALSSCSSDSGSDEATATDAATTETTETAEEAAEEAIASAGDVSNIAFFGFWKTNSFTQAVLTGVQEAAAEAGATVTDLTTADYDAVAQIKAVQDQTVKGDAQMYVVLASDSVGMATIAKEAIDAGITVVAAFTPLGPDFNTLDPQVENLLVVGETPVSNGEILAELAGQACEGIDPCNVAYLEGLKALPLDNARTQAFVAKLAEVAPQATIVAQVEGGYAPDSGKKAAQDALQANPNINVMVGSSQAIIGAQGVVDTSQVKLIGNGSSTEAFDAVNSGEWFALYNLDVVGMGAKSVQLGLEAASGLMPDPAFNVQDLRDPRGTADVIAGFTPAYSDLG
jgi:ribose transport system substrate-binding protein